MRWVKGLWIRESTSRSSGCCLPPSRNLRPFCWVNDVHIPWTQTKATSHRKMTKTTPRFLFYAFLRHLPTHAVLLSWRSVSCLSSTTHINKGKCKMMSDGPKWLIWSHSVYCLKAVSVLANLLAKSWNKSIWFRSPFCKRDTRQKLPSHLINVDSELLQAFGILLRSKWAVTVSLAC